MCWRLRWPNCATKRATRKKQKPPAGRRQSKRSPDPSQASRATSGYGSSSPRRDGPAGRWVLCLVLERSVRRRTLSWQRSSILWPKLVLSSSMCNLPTTYGRVDTGLGVAALLLGACCGWRHPAQVMSSRARVSPWRVCIAVSRLVVSSCLSLPGLRPTLVPLGTSLNHVFVHWHDFLLDVLGEDVRPTVPCMPLGCEGLAARCALGFLALVLARAHHSRLSQNMITSQHLAGACDASRCRPLASIRETWQRGTRSFQNCQERLRVLADWRGTRRSKLVDRPLDKIYGMSGFV